MKKKTATDDDCDIERYSFFQLIKRNRELAAARKDYASKPAEERRMAADWEYHSAIAQEMFAFALAGVGRESLGTPSLPAGILALAIDPLYAPALLTVGSMEYECGREEEAMRLFFQLTKLPKDEEDLPVIIDKAVTYLTKNEDYQNALELSSAAEKLDPEQSLYCAASGYCLSKFGRFEESIEKFMRVVAVEPENYDYLNDLGFALMEKGDLDEADKVLKKSKSLAPPDYEFPSNNLKDLHKLKRKREGNI